MFAVQILHDSAARATHAQKGVAAFETPQDTSSFRTPDS